jgi:hypothetical protein
LLGDADVVVAVVVAVVAAVATFVAGTARDCY